MNDRQFFGGLFGALAVAGAIVGAFRGCQEMANRRSAPAVLTAVDASTVLDRQLFARLCVAAVKAGDAGEIGDEFALNSWMEAKQEARRREAAGPLAEDLEKSCPTNPAPWSELRPVLLRWALEADPTVEVPNE